MSQKFRCMEEACDQEVDYKPMYVPGSIGFAMRRAPETPQEVVIYLTCPKGHTHGYTVTSIATKENQGG